jgi:SsrA-binding protein
MKILVQNRHASHDYKFIEKFEAGLLLKGSEVKSLKSHKASINAAFIIEKEGELYLHNATIASDVSAFHFAHEPNQERKLLLHKRQINKILGNIKRKGMTAVPLKIYISKKWIKIEIALAIGLKKVDKRHIIKEKEWKRQQHRILKKGICHE